MEGEILDNQEFLEDNANANEPHPGEKAQILAVNLDIRDMELASEREKNQRLMRRLETKNTEIMVLREWVLEKRPPLKNDNLLKAVRGENVDRIPVWVMGQAGCYLPEFQEVRQPANHFTICQTPELACKVTMQPICRFDLDASIIFSDILLIPKALGMAVVMNPEPFFHKPLDTPADLDKLKVHGAISRLEYVGKAITKTRIELEGKVPLIGFTGAPWTLMGYMIEGGNSQTMSKAKKWLTEHNEASHKLLSLLTDVIVDYLEMQVKSGAQMLQVFESSADYIDKEQFAEVSLPYVRKIRDQLQERLQVKSITPVPMVLYAKGGGHSLSEQAQCGYEVIGLDSTVDPIEARKAVGPNVTLQGNLDPAHMLLPEAELKTQVDEMIRKFGKKRYIVNLGHEIKPETPIESMNVLVETVHQRADHSKTIAAFTFFSAIILLIASVKK